MRKKYILGGKAEIYGGKMPIIHDYNYNTNLSFGREDIAFVNDKKIGEKIIKALELLESQSK